MRPSPLAAPKTDRPATLKRPWNPPSRPIYSDRYVLGNTATSNVPWKMMTNRLATMDLDASESDVGRTSGCVRSVQVDDLTVSTCSLVPRLGLVLRCACSEAADPASRRRMVHGQRIESPLLRPLHRSPASYADGAPTIGRGAPSVLGGHASNRHQPTHHDRAIRRWRAETSSAGTHWTAPAWPGSGS